MALAGTTGKRGPLCSSSGCDLALQVVLLHQRLLSGHPAVQAAQASLSVAALAGASTLQVCFVCVEKVCWDGCRSVLGAAIAAPHKLCFFATTPKAGTCMIKWATAQHALLLLHTCRWQRGLPASSKQCTSFRGLWGWLRCQQRLWGGQQRCCRGGCQRAQPVWGQHEQPSTSLWRAGCFSGSCSRQRTRLRWLWGSKLCSSRRQQPCARIRLWWCACSPCVIICCPGKHRLQLHAAGRKRSPRCSPSSCVGASDQRRLQLWVWCSQRRCSSQLSSTCSQ
jgi:hypothetical protein